MATAVMQALSALNTPGTSLSIDVTKDLESSSALKTMLQSNEGAIFNIGAEMALFADRPVAEAAAAGAKAQLTLNANHSWVIPSNGITFTLGGNASCSVAIAPASAVFTTATSIEDPTKTTKIQGAAGANKVYVNIELDFGIQGSVSGGATFSGVGIAGKAAGAATKTLSFCQPVDGKLNTADALKQAFSKLVFPFDPSCAEDMDPGSLCNVNFDGSFNVSMDVTYGLGSYQVSGSSVAQVQTALQKLQPWVKVNPPSLAVNAGAKGSVSFSHADHFSLLVNKNDAKTATVYLGRSAENDWGASVGVSVGVKATVMPSVSIDSTALQNTVQQVTGNAGLGSAVGQLVSQPVNNLQTNLNSQLKTWISDVSGQSALQVSLARQQGRVSLFTFSVDLTSPNVEKSWSSLVAGNLTLTQAHSLSAFVLLPGSGVADSLKRSSTIQFNLFNLYSFSSVSDFFSNGYAELGQDGTIRILRDIGQEQQVTTKKALAKFRIHFVASATEDALDHVSNAEVQLRMELSETGDSKAGHTLANAVGLIPANPVVHQVQDQMSQYLIGHPNGNLNLAVTVKESAFLKLSATPYNGKKPLPLPHEKDQNNWKAYWAATEALEPQLAFVPQLSFADWITYNRDCIDEPGSQKNPDRLQKGDPNAVPSSFYAGLPGAPALVSYFLQSSAGFMNLCADIQILGKRVPEVDTTNQLSRLLAFITDAVTNTVYIDYSKPTAGALLQQFTVGGANITASTNLAKDGSSLTCALTLA